MADIDKGSMQHSIVRSFDEATDSLKTTITNAAVDITVSAFTDSIAIADESGNKATTTLVGGKRGLDVNVTDITIDKSNDSIATESYEQSTRVDEAYKKVQEAQKREKYHIAFSLILIATVLIAVYMR